MKTAHCLPILVLAAWPAFLSAASGQTTEDAGKPLWELGVVGGAAYVPDYPAAGHDQFTGIALPLVIYRGDFLRSDEEGVRVELDLGPRTQLKLGVEAAFGADSDDNRDRRGMPDLDYLVEAGPSLEYRAWEAAGRSITLAAQLRPAFTINLDRFDYVGLAVEPQITYRDEAFLVPKLELGLGLGAKFGYDGLNDYFYEVEPRYATASRPAYRADDGYQQTALSATLFYPVTPRLSVFAGGQLLYLDGVANQDSPLHRENVNYAVGGGLAYALWVSKATVAAASR